MKNLNKVRNSKENKRHYLIFSNDEDALRRLWLIYKDFPTTFDGKESQWLLDIYGFNHMLVICMPAYEKDKMVSSVGLKKLKSWKYWVLD